MTLYTVGCGVLTALSPVVRRRSGLRACGRLGQARRPVLLSARRRCLLVRFSRLQQLLTATEPALKGCLTLFIVFFLSSFVIVICCDSF